jgi:ABC-type uncharacterized transport system substrate-binding protein
LPLLVADLLRRQVALIVGDTPAALAAKAATTTVPIVFATGGDPVRVGLVASLNRPGGNATGISFITAELGAKQLGLLRELRPEAARIAVLVDSKWPLTEPFVSQVLAAASAMGQQIEVLYVSSDREIETAFTTLHVLPVPHVPDGRTIRQSTKISRTCGAPRPTYRITVSRKGSSDRSVASTSTTWLSWAKRTYAEL